MTGKVRSRHPAVIALALLTACGRGTLPERTALETAATTPIDAGMRIADAAAEDAPPPAEPQAAAPTQQTYPFQQPTEPPPVAKSPAAHAANLLPGACRAELKKRGIVTARAGRAAIGVAAPVRLSSPLHGVRFITPGKKSIYGVLDCRLVVALDDLASVLEKDDVVAVHIDNFYRARAHLPGKKAKSQHAFGLAADVAAFTLKDGRTLLVERDFRAVPNTPTCGAGSRVAEPSDDSVALRNIVCDIVRAGVFHRVLTPYFNAAHENHLHLDIKRGERAIVVH